MNNKVLFVFVCLNSIHVLMVLISLDAMYFMNGLQILTFAFCGRGSARRSSSKRRERAIVSQTNTATVSKAALGKPLRDGWSAYGLFRALRYHLGLN